jgi:spectinomycin phosphotransferase
MPAIEVAIAMQDNTDPDQHELALFWRAQQQRIGLVVERADTLGDQLRRRNLPQVLCHADIHTRNVLVDRDGQLWIVDWDEIVLAPKERDLMFVIGGISRSLVSPHDTACFLQGYGETEIDQQALSYYRYAWAAQDIAAYGEQALLTPDVGAATRRNAVRQFKGLFAPGNIVDIACASGE